MVATGYVWYVPESPVVIAVHTANIVQIILCLDEI